MGVAWVCLRVIALLDIYAKDGVTIANTAGLLIVDAVPNVGSFFEGVSQQKNIPMLYAPVLTDAEHAEWFTTYWTEELIGFFQKGEVTVPNMERKGLGNQFGSWFLCFIKFHLFGSVLQY